MDLLEKIKRQNALIEKNNQEAHRAEARKELAEREFKAVLAEVNSLFGTKLEYDGTNLDELVATLEGYYGKVEAELTKVVEINDKVLALIESGDYVTANKVLGVSADEEASVEEEEDADLDGEVTDEDGEVAYKGSEVTDDVVDGAVVDGEYFVPTPAEDTAKGVMKPNGVIRPTNETISEDEDFFEEEGEVVTPTPKKPAPVSTFEEDDFDEWDLD